MPLRQDKKTVVILIWHLGIGGMQKRMLDIAREMSVSKPDYEICFLVKHRRGRNIVPELDELPNVEVRYCSQTKILANSPYFIIWLYFQLFKIRPQVCLTFLDYLSILLCFYKRFFEKGKDFRLVLNESMYTSLYLSHDRGVLKNLLTCLIKMTYPWADLIICPTKAGKLDLISNFALKAKSIAVLPNWTVLKFTRSKVQKKYDLLYIGRVEIEKGIDIFLKLAEQVVGRTKGVRIVVCGSGKNLVMLTNKSYIDYLGEVPNSQVGVIYKKSKILVLPTKNEGMPNTVLEAGVYGVSTVSSRFAGVDEVIENGVDGYVADNIDEMEEKIVFLLKNPKVAKEMGKKMQIKVKKYFGHNVQKKYINLLLK